jgi:iron complex transport system substrate-binding protein
MSAAQFEGIPGAGDISRRRFVYWAGLAGITGATLLTGGLGLAGCGVGPSTKSRDFEAAVAAGEPGFFEFVDSCGRRVALQSGIQSVSPSGPIAQLILATLCPQKMINLASGLSASQTVYLGQELADLPVLGRFYGASADLNYEGIIRMDPDIIVDIGETKPNEAADMDGLQERTGIPCIFVEATLTRMVQAYAMLGEALSDEQNANTLVEYASEVLSYGEARRGEIAAQGLRVLYVAGPFGTQAKEKGGIHAGVLDLLGVDNVAVLGETSSTEVSVEQIMIWAPEVVLLSYSDAFFDEIYRDPTWANIPAVKNRRVYEVPGKPYEWLDMPPSVQTLLGLLWLGNLLYPQSYDLDIVAEAQRFYHLFWHYELSQSEARDMLARSTFLT